MNLKTYYKARSRKEYVGTAHNEGVAIVALLFSPSNFHSKSSPSYKLLVDELIRNKLKRPCIQFSNLSVDLYNSERSDECIDFTMMCVFFFLFLFVSVYSITSRNNAPISNYGGGFQCKIEYPWCIIEFSKKSRKTKKKMTEKRQFLRKTSFRPNRFFFMVVIQKLITENT
ncbi:hypothetical protein AGLY_015269 [Aphis glycines]|uniref:Uncharacterized protein n=1 Tax=Aphis glycines TaxID=307491 RepID=A0A6G0T0Q5_APHGL|nr:hypothetical protein AGLY_015269 [Aphis glycines]